MIMAVDLTPKHRLDCNQDLSEYIILIFENV